MITLHILKLLEDAGFGTIDTDLFWEEIPVSADGNNTDGVWVISRGEPLARGIRTKQSFDIYTRYANKVTGAQKLHDILKYMKENFVHCTLPTLEESDEVYTNVTLEPTQSEETVGPDANGKIIRVISGTVTYNLLTN